MRKLLLATAATVGLVTAAQAAPVSVVQFSQTSASNDVTVANNTGLSGAQGATTISIADAVANISQLLDNLPVNGVDVTLNATSIDNAVSIGGAVLQHFNGSFCLSSGPGCAGILFLSGTFSDAAFGTATGSQLTVNVANPPDALSLTSSVIPASELQAPSSLNFAFTAVTPALSIASNNSIDAFTAAFGGNASASAVATPEPASLVILSVGLIGMLVLRRRHGLME